MVSCVLGGLATQAQTRSVRVPGETAEQTLQGLEARKQRQGRLMENAQVLHGFLFADGLATSGITFRHEVVAEAGNTDEVDAPLAAPGVD